MSILMTVVIITATQCLGPSKEFWRGFDYAKRELSIGAKPSIFAKTILDYDDWSAGVDRAIAVHRSEVIGN